MMHRSLDVGTGSNRKTAAVSKFRYIFSIFRKGINSKSLVLTAVRWSKTNKNVIELDSLMVPFPLAGLSRIVYNSFYRHNLR